MVHFTSFLKITNPQILDECGAPVWGPIASSQFNRPEARRGGCTTGAATLPLCTEAIPVAESDYGEQRVVGSHHRMNLGYVSGPHSVGSFPEMTVSLLVV
jgi:hypothetical protein